jgi:hypothetical protein
MVDEKLRLVSLSVVGGPLHGRRYDPDEVVTEILIGSDPDCHLVVDRPGVSPIHARVRAGLDLSVAHDTHAPRGLYVNTIRVQGQAPIDVGDVLWLGPPQDPESVCIQCRFEPWVEVLPPAVVARGAVEPAAAVGAPTLDAYEPVVLEGDAPSSPTETPAVVAPASPDVRPEDDPFFVGEGPGPAAPAAPIGAPLSAKAPTPAPEALAAETTADDWVIAEAEPAASTAQPASPPDAARPADTFFVGEETMAPAAEDAVFVEAEPLPPEPAPAAVLDAPPPHPRPPEQTPQPPEKKVAVSPTPAAPAAIVPEPRPPTAPSKAASLPAVEPARVEPRPPAARARREPSPVRRPVPSAAARPAPIRRSAPPARPARRASRGTAGWVRAIGFGAAGLAAVAVIAFGAVRLLSGGVRLESVDPMRLRVGQRATLHGSGFAPAAAGNTVLFDDREAKIVRASPTLLEVEVPEVVAESGAERQVGVVVRKGSRTSGVVAVACFQGPRLHGISPEAAMPGEEVLLAGAGWGPGTTVRFGSAAAQLTEVEPTRIRAVVPEGAGAPGTQAPVVVTVGGVESNPAPFIVGHLPVVSGVSPASAAPGDIVDVAGRGFQADPLRNDVRVGGVLALVLSAAGDALTVVVPRVGPGEASRELEVRVPGSESVGQAVLQVAGPDDPIGFHFVAEPFAAVPGRPYAVLGTGLGPAFVVAASGGKTAAARAVEAAARLNGAAQALRTTLGLNLEARGLDTNPIIGLSGRSEALLEVTAEDATAYNEDWTGLRGRGGPVTRARLARWWEALGRDIVLLTVRGERPRFAAALAPEGRVLAQLFDAARRTGRPGVPRQVVDEARPPLRYGLRLLALRVPASVTAAPASTLPVAAATPAPARLQLEGTWGGSQVEQGQRQYLTVRFRRGGGSISYEGGITFTMPLLSVEQPRRDQVRFSVQIRGGVRYYAATWDGETLAGSISTDSAGRNVVASFELHRR